MDQYKTFEDLLLWQKAHHAALTIYQLTDSGKLATDTSLRHQMRRAVVSIGSNIAEGHERKSPKEFIHFITIAKASCSELRSQILLTRDLHYITPEEAHSIQNQLEEINRIAAGLIKYLNSKK